MFKFFRLLLIILSLVAAILAIFAVTGSYKNESYLTDTYLINFHLNKLNLSKLLKASSFTKRSDLDMNMDMELETPSESEKRDWASSIISATGGDSMISSILSEVDYADLGLSDVYQLSYWGYCKGHMEGDSKTHEGTVGAVGKDFDNSNINYTFCTDPTPAYQFKPVEVFKQELKAKLDDDLSDLSSTLRDQIQYLVDNVAEDSFNIPKDLQDKLDLLNNLTKASFGLLLAGAVLAVVSIIIQILGCFMSPDSCCLSFLNFLYEVVVFIILAVGSILITFSMSYTRNKINDVTDDYGIKSYLSMNFYAFTWASTVAALLCLFFNLLGHCCGLFGTGRKKFRSQQQPAMAYDHSDVESAVSSAMSQKG